MRSLIVLLLVACATAHPVNQLFESMPLELEYLPEFQSFISELLLEEFEETPVADKAHPPMSSSFYATGLISPKSSARYHHHHQQQTSREDEEELYAYESMLMEFPQEFESFFFDMFDDEFQKPVPHKAHQPTSSRYYTGLNPPKSADHHQQKEGKSYEESNIVDEEEEEGQLPYYEIGEVIEDVKEKLMKLSQQYQPQLEKMMRQIQPTMMKVQKFIEGITPELENLFMSMQPDIMAMGEALKNQAIEIYKNMSEEDFEIIKALVFEQVEEAIGDYFYEPGSLEPMMPIEFDSMMMEEFGSMMADEFGSFEEPSFFDVFDLIVPQAQSLYEQYQPKLMQMYEKVQPEIEKIKQFAMLMQPELENLYMSLEPQFEALLPAFEPELEEIEEYAMDMSLEDIKDMVELAEEYMMPEEKAPKKHPRANSKPIRNNISVPSYVVSTM